MAKETPGRPFAEEDLDDKVSRTRLPKAGPWLLLEPQHWAIHSAAQLLLGILLELREEEDWKKFKGELLKFPVKEGARKIPKELVKGADIWQLTELLFRYYDEAYAAEVAALVLEAMDYKPRMDNLFVLTRLIRFTHLCLLTTLITLKQSDLKNFKDILSMFPFKEGYVSIPKGLLEEASVWELTELLLTYYDDNYAVEVTSKVLKAIDCAPLPEWFFRLTRKAAEQSPEVHVSRHGMAVVLSSKVIQGQEELVPSEKATKGLLERVTISGDEMLHKGRNKLIEILGEATEFFFKVLLSCRVITLKEYDNIFKMEKDSKEKTKKLLSIILERGEQACCRFLECIEVVHPGSVRILLFAVQGSVQIPFQVPGPLVRQWKGRSMKMENLTGPGKRVKCSWCPSTDLPDKIKPEVVGDSERGHEAYRVCPTEATSFHCCDTGLICEVRKAVTVTYHFDSWPKHLKIQNTQEWQVAGPLLNIHVDAVEAVAAIHIPHSLSLSGKNSSHVYIAHFVKGRMKLEKPDRVEPHHAVLKNPKFSSLGVIFRKWFKQKINTVVLLYHRLQLEPLTFHLYLLPNDPSIVKAVNQHEVNSRRIEKPPLTLKPLMIGSQVSVETSEDVTVCPEELKFQYLDAERLQQYLELSAEQMQERFTFYLMKKGTNKIVWKAHLKRKELISAEMNSPILHPPQGPQLPNSSDMHFIERHREALIQRTTPVEPVLDRLYGSVLTHDLYQKITAKETDPEKMRELFRLVPSWNLWCKNRLYEALKAKIPHLVNDLEGR